MCREEFPDDIQDIHCPICGEEMIYNSTPNISISEYNETIIKNYTQYDEDNNIIEHKNTNGNTLNYEYDKNNNLIEYIDFNGLEYGLRYKHNKQGMLLQIKENNKIILTIPNKMIEEN